MISYSIADFSQIDSFATAIAVVGYLVVFIALVLLYLVFYNLPLLLSINLTRLFGKKKENKSGLKKNELRITGEVNAAIGLALYLYMNEIHDEESGVITIKKIYKRYSPWSSKIYGLRQNPRY